MPIVCIKHQKKYFILDGHARSIRAEQLGLQSLNAVILLPETEIEFGIVKTAREMNLRSLDDLLIVD